MKPPPFLLDQWLARTSSPPRDPVQPGVQHGTAWTLVSCLRSARGGERNSTASASPTHPGRFDIVAERIGQFYDIDPDGWSLQWRVRGVVGAALQGC